MIPLRFLALVRDYKRHPWLPIFSLLGVALGVAVVVALDLAIESARGSLADAQATVAGRATHQITGVAGPLDETLYARIKLEGGVRLATPIVEGFIRASEVPDRPLRLLGVDPFAEAPFRDLLGSSQVRPSSGSSSGVTALVPGRLAVILPAAVAEPAGIVVGDSLTVRGPGGSCRLVVAGVFDPGDRLSREGSADLLLADVSTAQIVLGRMGLLDRVDLILPDDEQAVAQVAALLPPDALLRTSGARAESLTGMTRAFEINLMALSLLALVFGVFLIYNAMTFSVVRRRERIGMMHALGVTRREVLTSILIEAALVGMVGALLGLALGVLMGRGLVGLVTQTVNDLYTFVRVDGLRVEGPLLLKGFALGVVTTLLATLPPAWEAASAQATRAMRRSALEERTRLRILWAAGAGVAAGLMGVLAFTVGPSGLAAGFVGLALVMGAIALLTPISSMVIAGALAPVAGLVAGNSGRMAVRGVVRSLSRTGPALAALVVAVSVTVGLGAMISSFRLTVVQWLDQTLQADVYVSAATLGVARVDQPLPRALVEGVRSLSGTDYLSTYRGLDFDGAWGPMRLVALDLAVPGEAAFRFKAGDPEEIFRSFRTQEAVLVSEPFSERTGIDRGDVLTLPTPQGDRSFRVAGNYYDYGSDRGVIMLARTTYDLYWDDDDVTSLGLFANQTTDTQALVDRVRGIEGAEDASVRSNRSLRQASLAVFDRTFTVTGVLRLLAFIVAFIGILGALMAIEIERSHEFGLLRATGLTPGGLWRLIIGETGFMGLLAGVLAIPAGALLAAIMVFVINKRSFGWTLELTLSADVILQSLALAVVGALLAGVYPAYRIARAPAATVLRVE